MTAEDLTTIQEAGRRCSSCHTGRNWRRLEVLRPEGHAPIVTCPACKPRLEARVAEAQAAEAAAVEASKAPAHDVAAEGAPVAEGAVAQTEATGEAGAKRPPRRSKSKNRSTRHRDDRLGRGGSRERPAGKHASPEANAADLQAAFDRLQATARNVRVVREPAR